MKRLNILLFPLLVVAVGSCRKIIEPKDLPQQDPMIVVNCILNTDETIHANISQSKSILSGKDYKYIDNAVCELYENDVYLQNLSFNSKGDYYLPFFPKSGKKYSLKVAASGFESVSASTQMPYDFNVKPIERYDTTVNFYRTNYGGSIANSISGEMRFRIRIVDDPATLNFYSIEPLVMVYDSLDQPLNYSVTTNLRSYNEGNLSNGESYGDRLNVDDKTIVNGNEIQRNLGVYISVPENEEIGRVKKVKVVFKIGTLSEDYYRYRETLWNQVYNSGSLFAEPVQVYNNIDKGAGILAGINTMQMQVYYGEVGQE